MGYPLLDIDPTLVNDATFEATRHTLGRIYEDGDGKLYRFVQFKDAVTYAAGQVCCWKTAALESVTNDISGALGAIVAGICLRVMTADYYGFVLVSGRYSAIVTSGADDIAIGESLIVHATTDGACDGVAAGSTTTASFGVALAADVDAANTVDGLVRGLV